MSEKRYQSSDDLRALIEAGSTPCAPEIAEAIIDAATGPYVDVSGDPTLVACPLCNARGMIRPEVAASFIAMRAKADTFDAAMGDAIPLEHPDLDEE